MRVDRPEVRSVVLGTNSQAAVRRRRVLLQGGALLTAWLGCGMVGGRTALAAAATTDPIFGATLMADVIRAMGGVPMPTTLIDLEVPDLSENGALVPVSVTSRLPGTTRIALLAEANPFPMIASFDFGPDTEPYVSTRVKLAQSCRICTIVAADGRLYSTERMVAITQGGCGE